MFYRAIIVVLIALAVWGALARSSGASSRGGGYYVVESGDSLWSIADRFYGGDTRAGVWQLEQQNRISDDGAITPGERLRLPW